MKPVGWRYDSWRHSLASKGVSSGRRYNMATNVRLPQYQIAEIKARLGQEMAEEAKRRAIAENMTAKQLAEEFNVPYVRKMKMGPMPERAYVGGLAAVERLEEGPRLSSGWAGPDLSEEQKMKMMMRVDGTVYLRNELERLEDLRGVAKRRVYTRQYELTKAIESGRQQEVEYYQGRLNDAREMLKEAEEKIERTKSFAGHEEDFLPESERVKTIERVLIAPKREIAIADAREMPVIAVLPMEVERPVVREIVAPPRQLQLRISKFLARKKRF